MKTLKFTMGASFINNHGKLLPTYTWSTAEMLKENFHERCAIPLDKFVEVGGKVTPVLLIEIGSEEEMLLAVKNFVNGYGRIK